MEAENTVKKASRISPSALAALDKFMQLIDDFGATRDTTRRLLFELLRAKPTLSTDEIDTIWAIEEFLADLEKARSLT